MTQFSWVLRLLYPQLPFYASPSQGLPSESGPLYESRNKEPYLFINIKSKLCVIMSPSYTIDRRDESSSKQNRKQNFRYRLSKIKRRSTLQTPNKQERRCICTYEDQWVTEVVIDQDIWGKGYQKSQMTRRLVRDHRSPLWRGCPLSAKGKE